MKILAILLVLLSIEVAAWSALDVGFTDHFQRWLIQNGFEKFSFQRMDVLNGKSVFGGKTPGKDTSLRHDPVIFIHGNNDIGVGQITHSKGDEVTGFTENVQHFLKNGFTKTELYVLIYDQQFDQVLTWGTPERSKRMLSTHNKETIMYIRAFIEAVIRYTGALKVDIIAHSMGVTLARRAVKGGVVSNAIETYNVGKPLTKRIDTFIAISGMNSGSYVCQDQTHFPYCNRENGFFTLDDTLTTSSKFLEELNKDPNKEGYFVFSVYSTKDLILGKGSLEMASKTAEFPTIDGYVRIDSFDYSHLKIKDMTIEIQYELVIDHAIKSNEFTFYRNHTIDQERGTDKRDL